jgi:hypothetical protein
MNMQNLRAIVDCIIPADEFPGASESGVCEYLRRLFETDLRDEAEFFATGIESIEREAHARFGAPFATLPPAQQVITLETIQHGDVLTSWPIAPQRFFEMLVCTTAEGFYTGAVSWTMTGFEDQQ